MKNQTVILTSDSQHHPAQSSPYTALVIYREPGMRVCVGRADHPRKEQIAIKRQSTEKCVNRTETEAFFYNSDVRDNVPERRERSWT